MTATTCRDDEGTGRGHRHSNAKTWKQQIAVDPYIYTLRNRTERCFKNPMRRATRYHKTADNYLGFVPIAAIRLRIRALVNRAWVGDLPSDRPVTLYRPDERMRLLVSDRLAYGRS